MVGLALCQPAAAQELLIDPGAAHLRRDLQQLEQELRTSPESVDQGDVNRVRRALVREGRGVAFTPEQARINRRLDRIQGAVARRQLEEELPAPTESARGDPLPSTYGGGAPLPSMRRVLVMTEHLLDSAEEGLGDGRVHQAASDHATARGILDGAGAADGALVAEIDRLQARMLSLEDRLGTPKQD